MEMYTYKNKLMRNLTEEELESVSELFSNHYGIYSNDSPVNPGQRVRLNPGYYNFKTLMAFSEEKLKDAYGRMKDRQPWKKYTSGEVEFILNDCNMKPGSVVLDFGCGNGRHAVSFAEKGLHVTGIDFSPDCINEAKKSCRVDLFLDFCCADCRTYCHPEKADMVIALYDVVGSFPDEKDNIKILKNAYDNLNKNGFFVCSVMNMELTKYNAKQGHIGNVMQNPKVLQNLPAGNIMESTGDIFNPNYYYVDEVEGIVYRKEQFYESGLPAEYVIRDKRYCMSEFESELENVGFNILDIRFVQAGRWNEKLTGTDNKAKEILAVCTKL